MLCLDKECLIIIVIYVQYFPNEFLGYFPVDSGLSTILCLVRICWVDPGMVKIQNLEYSSKATIVFQRLTVVTADILLVYACYQ